MVANLAADGKITALEGLSGMAILLARTGLELDGLQLGPPSQCGLIAIPEMGSAPSPYLKLRGGSFRGTSFTPSRDSLLRIGEDAHAAGFVYSAGKLERQSRFEGHIFTRILQSSSGARTFTNWFKETRVDRAVDRDFVAPLGFSRKIRVLQWGQR